MPGSRPGIYVVAGGGVSDTVGAIQTQALIVEVYSARGIRAPAATTVQFASVDNEMAVGPLAGSAFGGFTTAALDADGRAAIRVRMGFKAGSARIEMSVPTFDLIDTVNFIVTAGKAARIVISPSDTLLYFDVSYSVTGKVTDAHNNPRPDAVSWITPAGSPVTVSAAGVVAPGTAGRHSFTAASGSVTATAMVSALPRLKLVAYRYDPSPPAIVSMDLDGSNLKVLTSATETGIGAHPAWIPGTNMVAFSSVTASNQVIRVVNEANVASPTAFIATPPATMTHQVEPSPSNNGMWMYFSASDTRCGDAADYCVFRSTFNGSSVELLAAGFPSRQPAPSPDGSKVAFTRNVYPATVRVLDIASGVVSSWSVAGQHAQWSPDGSMIAFWGDDARITVINADGSGLRSITSAFAIYEGPISWSPDSRFIVARAVSPGVVDLIEVATGTAITLPNTGTLQAPQVK